MFREVNEQYLIPQICLDCECYASFWIGFVAELSASVIFLYLLLSGDVELNPGPKIGENWLLNIS